MASPYDALRAELDAAQKTRDELMKWKAIAVTGIGAAALGFSESTASGAHFALAVIPFACAYLDLLCRNLSLRTKRISHFLRMEKADDPIVRFEVFYKATKGRSSLESLALVGSSIALSLVIIPLGIAIGDAKPASIGWPNSLFWGAGLLGVVMAAVVEGLYKNRKQEIAATPDNTSSANPGTARGQDIPGGSSTHNRNPSSLRDS